MDFLKDKESLIDKKLNLIISRHQFDVKKKVPIFNQQKPENKIYKKTIIMNKFLKHHLINKYDMIKKIQKTKKKLKLNNIDYSN